MLTALAWGALAVLMTELLNLARRLDASGIAIGWVLILLGLLGLLVWLYPKAPTSLPALPGWLAAARTRVAAQDALTWIMLTALMVQAVLLLAVALSFAPNTYESMTYQLTRPLHWLQNGSLASFASNNVREDYFPPFAEYVFMHLMALTGGDRYVDLVQWGSYLFAALGVSALAAEFGAKSRTQLAAALLAAAIPMGVLQATAARNDLLLSVWLLSLVWFGLRWGRQPGSWVWATATGLALGLALLTKPSSLPFGLPLALWIGILAIKSGGVRLGFLRGGFVVLLALILNVGHFGRNWDFYADPVGIHARVRNDLMSPAIFVSNALRNIAMHVPVDCEPPLTFLNQPGQLVLSELERLHALTGQDPTDSRTSWGSVNVFDGSLGCSYDEHYAGNALHGLLIFFTILALPFLRPLSSPAKWLALSLVVGFGLLSLALRWQVWGSHLQLPLFVLWMPIVAVVLGRVERPDLRSALALLTILLSFLWTYNNRPRPLADLLNGAIRPRLEQYFFFAGTSFVYPQYRAASELIAGTGCDRVGLNITSPPLNTRYGSPARLWIRWRDSARGCQDRAGCLRGSGVCPVRHHLRRRQPRLHVDHVQTPVWRLQRLSGRIRSKSLALV